MSNINNISHHRVFPTNTKSSYSQLNNIDWELSFPNRKMVCNSVRIEGNVRFNSSGNVQITATDKVYIDHFVGANALISDIQTVTANQGSIELISELPKYEKMVTTAMSSPDDMNNISNLCELKSQNIDIAHQVLLGNANEQKPVEDPNTNEPISFSIKPNFALNQVSNMAGGNVDIRSDTTGDVRVSVRLSRNTSVFWGEEADANYTITNLSLTYLSVPDDGQQEQLTVRTKLNISQSIQASFSNISVNVPSKSNGVSMVFLEQDKENNILYNNTQLDRPPNIDTIEFLFNDQTNKYITYRLDTQEQFLNNYLESISRSSDVNSFTLANVKNNQTFGVGVNFNQLLDLSVNRFGMNIKSAITNNAPYILYLFFHGFQTIG